MAKTIKIEWVDGKNQATLLRAINIEGYPIPAGTTWDGASIPTVVTGHLFITPWHRTVRYAGLLHDYLYQTAITTRKRADLLYRIRCRKDGCNPVQAWSMYLALRLFGGIAWRKHRNNKQSTN